MSNEPIDPKELTQALYTAWRQHPMTQTFRKFLADYAARMREQAMARWSGGNLDPKVEDFARGVVNALEEISSLEWQTIMAFYGIGPEEKEEGEDGKSPTE